MSVIRSGYSDARAANTAADAAPPAPPTDLIIESVGQHGPAGARLPEIGISFIAPTTTILTAAESLTDDEYDSGSIVSATATPQGTNDTNIATATDLSAVLVPGDRILFAGDVNRYPVVAATATPQEVELLYGLQTALDAGTVIRHITKTAESPADSHIYRLNARIAVSATIYTDDAVTKSKWNLTTALGQWEDLNKVIGTINEAGREWTAHRVIYGATPMVALSDAAGGTSAVVVNFDPALSISAGQKVGFTALSSDEFYEVYALTATPDRIVLAAPLAENVAAGAEVWIKDEFSIGATPYVFPDYSAISLADVDAETPLVDLGGYYLYCQAATPATQEAKGTRVVMIPHDEVTVDGARTEYTWDADSKVFEGDRVYFSLSAYDQEIPLPNESTAALNATTITYPGNVTITEFTEDRPALQAVLVLDKITERGDGSNIHLLEVMNQATAQYSTRGGYDIYLKSMTALAPGSGVYEGLTATTARFSHSEILLGDQVRVVDGLTRHEWITQSEAAGKVEFSDADLVFGDLAVDYLAGHKVENISAFRATIDRTTDSVLPLSSEATPQKQYLTDFNDSATISIPSIGLYAIAAEAIDTEA